MARMRTIKPEFWTDSVMIQLSPLARLLYIGMWNFALCDEGHLENDPIRIKLQILPAENVSIEQLLDELSTSSRIVYEQVQNGETYIRIPTLKKQRGKDSRWQTRCPACNHAENDSTVHKQTPQSFTENNSGSAELKQKRLVEESRGEESNNLSMNKFMNEFEEWWLRYPKKQSKKPALKAFIKARKTVSLETLNEGLTRYIESVAGKDPQFIALAGTWLNAERWNDEPAKVVSKAEAKNIDPKMPQGWY